MPAVRLIALAVMRGVRPEWPHIFRCMLAWRATWICSLGAGIGLDIYIRQVVGDEGASVMMKRGGDAYIGVQEGVKLS